MYILEKDIGNRIIHFNKSKLFIYINYLREMDLMTKADPR